MLKTQTGIKKGRYLFKIAAVQNVTFLQKNAIQNLLRFTGFNNKDLSR